MQFEQRFSELQSGRLSSESIQELYGIELSNTDFEAISRVLNTAVPANNRALLEYYLYKKSLYTRKQAAFRLGVMENSLGVVLQALKNNNPDEVFPEVHSKFFKRELIDDISSYFIELQNEIFSDHDSFLVNLHSCVARSTGGAMHINPALCQFYSKAVEVYGEGNVDKKISKFGIYVDAFNGNPVGITNRLYIETNKAIYAEPDSCSYLTYFVHEAVLSLNLFPGSRLLLPKDLISQVCRAI